MKTYTTQSEEETLALAEALGRTLAPGTVIAYQGGLGVGKTTFTRGLAMGLGIDPALVSSPTFALIQEYPGEQNTLVHFDMYRITDEESLFFTGFYDYLDTDSILAIEWSENIEEFLPSNRITVALSSAGENQRKIVIEGSRL